MKKILLLKPGIIFILLLPLAYVAPDNSRLVVNMIGYFFYCIWIGTIGYYVPKPVIKNEIKSDTALFFGSLLLFPILLMLTFTARAGIFGETVALNWIKGPAFVLIIYAAMFYPVMYVSKAIVKMELKKEVSFSDYILTIVLLIPGVSLVGVWFVQPRISKLFSNAV